MKLIARSIWKKANPNIVGSNVSGMIHPALFILLLVIVLCSCEPPAKKSDFQPGAVADSASARVHTTRWADSLIVSYINQTGNELIRSAPKDSISWMLDRVEATDTASYLVYQIAIDVADGDSNRRMVPVGWVYIDSLTRKVYEYDLPNERLIRWDR